jgi:hypothetical protein
MVIASAKRIAIRPPLPGPFKGMSIARRGEWIGLIAGRQSGTDLVDIPERIGLGAVAEAAFAKHGRHARPITDARDLHCTLRA